jgi:predicted metal-dependent hydrolase
MYHKRMRAHEEQMDLFGQTAKPARAEPDSWEVRRNPRARRIAIHVLVHGAVEIVAPPRASAREIHEFVTLQKDWIDKARAKVLRSIERQGPLLPEVIELKAIGRRIQVNYALNPKPGTELRADLLTVNAVDITPGDCWPLLKTWLRQTGRKTLPELLRKQAELTGLKPKRVQVRNQKTRWGSCSSHGTISLNAAILLLEPQQANYVLIHELCHLQHMNHSDRYWSLVGSHVPHYRQIDKAVDAFWRTGPAWPR